MHFGLLKCCYQIVVVQAKEDWDCIRIPMSMLSCQVNQYHCFLDVQAHIQEQQASNLHPPFELYDKVNIVKTYFITFMLLP